MNNLIIYSGIGLIVLILIFVLVSKSQDSDAEKQTAEYPSGYPPIHYQVPQSRTFPSNGDIIPDQDIYSAERGDFRDVKRTCNQYKRMACKGEGVFGRRRCKKDAYNDCIEEKGYS